MLGPAQACNLSTCTPAGAKWYSAPPAEGNLLSAASLPGSTSAGCPLSHPPLPAAAGAGQQGALPDGGLATSINRILISKTFLLRVKVGLPFIKASTSHSLPCSCRCWAALFPTWWRPGSFSASMGL